MKEGKDPAEVTEKYVLGSIIDLGPLPLDNDDGEPGNQVLKICRKYGVSEKSFSNSFAGKIYAVMDELDRSSLKCDAATVRTRLENDPDLRGERGKAHLNYLIDVLGEGDDGGRGSGTYEYHIRVLRAHELQRIGLEALNRGICRLTNLTAHDLYDLNYVRMIMGDVERDVFKANERISQPVNMEQAYSDAAAALIKEMDGPEAISGLLTGYKSLDETLFGMKPGDLLILAARPSVGKTALAVNIAMNVVKDDKKRVLFVSLEMSTTALAKRILAGEIKFDSVSAKNGLFSTEERKRQEEKIKAAEAAYKSRKLIINDKVGHEISDVRALARREKRNEGGLDLVIVDYLQLMESREHSRQNNRQLVVGHISGQLKQMALELECPVLVLSQLSRNNENREDKRPQLSDLRDSGAIEQDADVVILLSDPNKGKADNGGSHDLREPKLISVDIAKNRNGNVRDDIKLNFYGNYTKFEELHASQ